MVHSTNELQKMYYLKPWNILSTSISCRSSGFCGMSDCNVIGSTGSQEKVNWLLDQARIEHAFNYKEVGVDLYFKHTHTHVETKLYHLRFYCYSNKIV